MSVQNSPFSFHLVKCFRNICRFVRKFCKSSESLSSFQCGAFHEPSNPPKFKGSNFRVHRCSKETSTYGERKLQVNRKRAWRNLFYLGPSQWAVSSLKRNTLNFSKVQTTWTWAMFCKDLLQNENLFKRLRFSLTFWNDHRSAKTWSPKENLCLQTNNI